MKFTSSFIKKSLVAVAVLLSAAAIAQSYIRHVGRDRSLSNNYIMGIAQDRDGFVWLSTEHGLNRFDGLRFTPFMSGKGTLASDQLNRIAADTVRNILWVASQRNGLDAMNCSDYSVTHYGAGTGPMSLSANGITDVRVAAPGKVWVSTYTSGVDFLDTDSRRTAHYNKKNVKGWPDDHVWTAVEAPDGKVLVGHVFAGFTVLDPAKRTAVNFRKGSHPGALPGDEVRSIFVDRKRNIWVGTDAGLALYDPQGTFRVFRHVPGNQSSLVSDRVFHITQTDDDRLWISTENGGVSILDLHDLVLRDAGEVKFTNLTPERGDSLTISNKSVHAVFEDSFGNVWIGTYGDGADIICHGEAPALLLNADSPGQPVSDNPVMSLSCVGDTVYVGTDGLGVDILKGHSRIGRLDSSNMPIGDDAVLAISHGPDGTLWIGTYGGSVASMSRDGRKRGWKSPGVSDIRDILPLCDGSTLLATGQGIMRISPAGEFTRPAQAPDGRSVWLRSLLRTPGGEIWEGSFGGGIAIYSDRLEFKRRIDISAGLRSNTVNQLLLHPNGDILAATDDGLAIISDKGKVKRIVSWHEGLPGRHVKALSFDRQGRLWIATPFGVGVMDTDGKLSSYGSGYGLDNIDFSGGAAILSKDGKPMFGSHNGLHILSPQGFENPGKLPRPIITGITVYGRDRNCEEKNIPTPKSTIELPHDENSLLVNFGVLDAAIAPMVQWNYCLGDDVRQYPANPETGILLRNLKPGTYKLTISASLPDSQSISQTSIEIKILPPFWASWWARALYILAALILIYIAIRTYKRRTALELALKEEKRRSSHEHALNAEKLRFFTNITHELRTPLTLILGPLDDLKADTALPLRQSAKVGMIHKAASRLLDLINTILEFRKTETDNKALSVEHGRLDLLVEEIGRRYQDLNGGAQTAIVVDIEKSPAEVWFDRDAVSMIVDNLMSNACKYTPKGTVTLSLRATEEAGVPFMEIAVADTGIGIDPETLPRIFDRYYRTDGGAARLGTGIGLALVYNLVQLHEGEIFVDSTPGRGSTFRFRIHADNTNPTARRATKQTLQNAPAPADEDAPSPEKSIVLIVDDNVDILQYMQQGLEADYTVVTATDGLDGLAKAREAGPDIIVTDVMMPRLGGIDMIAKLKSDPLTSHIPIVVVTAKVADAARIEAYEAGADSFITTPFSMKILQARLRNILAMRHRQARRLIEVAPAPQAGGASGQPSTTRPQEAEGESLPIVSEIQEADAKFLSRLTSIIDARLAEDLDVGYIASEMFMSHSTLYRKVKGVTGMSVSRFVRKYRAQKAAELLATRRYTISEVAMMVGMESQGNFRACFREEFGMNPSEYLKQNP